MGHIAHLRNQFKSINTFAQSYDHITLIWGKKNNHLLLDQWMLLICTTWVSFTKGCLCQVEIGPVVLEEKILNFSSIYFRYFVIIFPWWPFIWTNMNLYSPKDTLCQFKFGWNWPSGFSIFVNVSLLFRNWKRAWASFEQTWIPFT